MTDITISQSRPMLMLLSCLYLRKAEYISGLVNAFENTSYEYDLLDRNVNTIVYVVKIQYKFEKL